MLGYLIIIGEGIDCMKLVDITIENFRGIRNLRIPLDDLTVLIGENNTGKSTVLEALRLALVRGLGSRKAGQLGEYDFHLIDGTATPQTSKPVKIILHFAESRPDEWPDAIIQQLEPVPQVDTTGVYHVWLQVGAEFNPEIDSFETRWSFRDLGGNELILKNTGPLILLQRFVPLFFLSALRDASQEFGRSGRFWSGFLKSIQLPDADRLKIEKVLEKVNAQIIDANTGLAQVIQKISEAKKLVALDSYDPVVLEAIPTRVFDMVGKIQVHLKSLHGAKLPLTRHGEGTQSLAVLLLFQAFTAANLAEAYTPESTPILALEEPEAHLHPSAIRSLGSFLNNMSGQILLSSHSGDLISRVPIESLRRLYKVDGETHVGHIAKDDFTSRELQAIDYNIRLTRGAYVFSRSWLLVEGESDYHLMPLLFEIMGYFQDQVSFSVLEISQAMDKGEPFIKFADALGIEWFLMADGDTTGKDYVQRASKHLKSGENLSDRARSLDYADIEHEFWNAGFDSFIEKMVSERRKKQIEEETDDGVKRIKLMIRAAIKKKGGKPAFSQVLAAEVRRRGPESIPQSLQGVIKRVCQLAGGQHD